MRRRLVSRWLAMLVLAAGCATTADFSDVPRWPTHAIPEGRGDVRTGAGGQRVAVRYAGWSTRDFGAFRTYAYDDTRPEPAVQRVTPPPGLTGDVARGRALFLDRAKGPCSGCHLVPGDDVWPAGGVGPDLSTLADRKLTDAYLYQQLWDPRVTYPKTVMPPWGAQHVFTPQQIVDVVAYLQSLHGPLPPEKDPERNPATRHRPVGFGDNLDPTNNPAIVRAESAATLWSGKGPAGKACVDCHAGGVEASMRGVATRYPRYIEKYRRVMSIEDFLTVHGPETTGRGLEMESADNLDLTMLIKMASNGLPVSVDTTSAPARAALARGKATFERRVGERNHACADCHTPEHGANKFLGGRLLGDVTTGATRHFPTWRTSQNDAWDMRKRF
ncbi:MAG TPA: sulfur oxidation c-type cytochrome SoxA, partial [Methylomirabilota bacterium]|nr:sulfur oxidation c-type cytochrome SoxA [Methylomirabilota bacterium]